MFKNKFLIVIAFLMVPFMAFGQGTVQDNRTIETKIADLLAQMPAHDGKYLNTLMTEMSTFGEDGLVSMAKMLTPTGKGSDAPVRFAIGSFSKFVADSGQEEKRILCEKAWCQALELIDNTEVKSFLIAQIQTAGDDYAIPFLKKYLNDDQLSDPACRALATIHSAKAGRALLNALDNAHGISQISIIEALGDVAYSDALDKITTLTATQDPKLKKVLLYALAQFGSPQSAQLLYSSAQNSRFTFEPTEATASYLVWIKKLIENGNKTLAEKQCSNLIKTCTADNQVQTRSAALSLLVSAAGEKAASYLYAAVNSNNRQYLFAALGLSQKIQGKKYTQGWIHRAAKLTGQTKADVITMLGDRGDQIALPFLKQSLKDNDDIVRLAAINATAKIGRESVLSDLLDVMKQGNSNEIEEIKTQLFTFKGNDLFASIANALPAMPSNSRIALIEILASRRASSCINQVYQETKSEDTDIRLAALKALKDLVSEKDLNELYGLLLNAKTKDEISSVQDAVIAAVKCLPEAEQTNAVAAKLESVPPSARKLFYKIFAGIGSNRALKTVVKDFKEGKGNQKDAAFEALTNWSNRNAIYSLCNIGLAPENSAYREQALQASVKAIHESGYPDDQRFLLLRKAMDMANTDNEKVQVLKEIGTCHTYLALKYAANYLYNSQLQQETASVVSSIILSDKSFYGDDVKGYLTRILAILTGPESEYQKEAIRTFMASMPSDPGFIPLFNEKDLTGWKGLVGNPIERSKMKPSEMAKAQVKADEIMRKGWKVENGMLIFTGDGNNLCTTKQYGDFEMFVDWKITDQGDAGIYLRGSPQVQIWDTTRHDVGAEVGSGGLYNNETHERNPLTVADNPIGEWNTFRIIMLGERVTVYLNGVLVVDNVIMENYWDRGIPIFPVEQIELQAHGTWVGYRDLYIKELPRPEPYKVSAQEKAAGYTELFDGISMFNWTGNTKDYVVENGCIACYPKNGGKGNLYTKAEYSNFSLRFEFQLTPGANNGIGIRTPLEGDAAYVGMEIQVLDNTADIYKNLHVYQYHGSVYGVIPAKREYLKPVGEWNAEEIIAQGTHITVILNGTAIVDGDIAEASKNGTMDGKKHPGLLNPKGHIGFLGHGSDVKFRNIRIKEL